MSQDISDILDNLSFNDLNTTEQVLSLLKQILVRERFDVNTIGAVSNTATLISNLSEYKKMWIDTEVSLNIDSNYDRAMGVLG